MLSSDVYRNELEMEILGKSIDKIHDEMLVINDLNIVPTNIKNELRTIYIKLFDLWKKENESVQTLRSKT